MRLQYKIIWLVAMTASWGLITLITVPAWKLIPDWLAFLQWPFAFMMGWFAASITYHKNIN